MPHDTRQHILIMSSWFPTRFDMFVGNFVERFAQLLSTNYQVSVIHTHGDPACNKLEQQIDESNGVHTVRVYHPVSQNKLRHWYWQRKALNHAFHTVEDVDLIFAHVILPRGLQFIKAHRYYHCPLIVMEHASNYREEISKHFSRLQRAILKRTSLHINELLACSEFLQQDMKTVFPTTKSTVLPNFVDSNLFYPAATASGTRNRFLHVSTLDPAVKDPETLLKGVAKVVGNGYTQVQLTVVSDQPTHKWQKMAVELNIHPYVTFCGPKSWEAIAEAMRTHDAFVLTSIYETFSIVLAEAWLSGLPTITTPVGIGKDLDPSLGVQIATQSPDSLAQAMQDFMDGKYTFQKDVIRERGLQYREENVISQLKTIFDRHLDAHE